MQRLPAAIGVTPSATQPDRVPTVNSATPPNDGATMTLPMVSELSMYNTVLCEAETEPTLVTGKLKCEFGAATFRTR